MKTLNKILIGGIIFLSGCNPATHARFDLSRLELWQRDLFIEAGNYWNISIKDNKNSLNVAFLGDIKDKPKGKNQKYIAFTYNYTEEGEKKHQIIFDKKETWSDCSKVEGFLYNNPQEINGYNFLKISQHELGHFMGKGHSDNKKDVMYHQMGKRCKN